MFFYVVHMSGQEKCLLEFLTRNSFVVFTYHISTLSEVFYGKNKISINQNIKNL